MPELTTAQVRRLPLLAVNTGDGKGKSSAAFGTALRSFNAGWSVAVFQFVKSAKWRVGEEAVFRRLAELHESEGLGGPVEWHTMGTGWSWSRTGSLDPQSAPADAAREGWAEIRRRLERQAHDLYVLDEFTYPMSWGWVDTAEVVEVLRTRPGTQHVIVTGRNAPEPLVELADLVTEMRKVKHPFDVGRKGQRGIEW